MTAESEGPSADAETQASVSSGMRQFLLPLILPGVLQGKAQTFVSPMLPLFVVELGGSHSMVGTIASAYAVAQFFGSAPVGVVMQHLHYATAACMALSLQVTTAVLSFVSQSVYMLLGIRIVGGIGATAFDISRKAYIAAEVPSSVRGRVVAFLASFQKWAVMISALLSGIVAEHMATRSVFLVQALLSLSALLLIAGHRIVSRRRQEAESFQGPNEGTAAVAATTNSTRSPPRPPMQTLSLSGVLGAHWRSLVGAGLYCAMLTGVRNTWMVALPLRGHHIGLSKVGIGVAVAGFRACDASVTFLAAGHIMDKYGLKAAAIPSMILMGASFALLSTVRNPVMLGVAAVVAGVGNGICGGIVNAFATGLAPAHARTQFLGLWKTVTATGGILLPPLFGAVSDATSLDIADFCISGAAFFAVVWILLMVREIAPKAVRETQVTVSLAAPPVP